MHELIELNTLRVDDDDKICNAHTSTLLGAQGANPETPGQAPTLSQ